MTVLASRLPDSRPSAQDSQLSVRLPRWLFFFFAALILAGGAWLRFKYYESGHGQSDEQITREVVHYMRQSGDWDTNWKKANLPPDLRYDQYNFSSHLYATYFFYRAVKLVPGTERWRSERNGFLVYRALVAGLATLAIVQTLLLGRRAGGPVVGLLAAVVVAVLPLLVQDAHCIRPEPFCTVLTLVAVQLAWPRNTLSLWRVTAAAACIGLLVACKVSMLALAWLPLVPLFAASSGFAAALRPRPVALIGLGLLGGFILGVPYALANPSAFIAGIKYLTAQYSGMHPPHGHASGAMVGDMIARYLLATLGWATPALFLAGSWSLARARRWAEFALLVGPVLLFLGYFATRTVFFERNFSHVLPLAAVVVAVGGVRLMATLPFAFARQPMVAASLWLALVLALTLRPGSVSWRLIVDEYSGGATGRWGGWENALREKYPQAEFQSALLFDPSKHDELAQRFANNSQPVLLRLTDYRDEWSARVDTKLRERFEIETAAVYHGTFAEQPTSTLLTYHRPTMRYYLVKGLRAP